LEQQPAASIPAAQSDPHGHDDRLLTTGRVRVALEGLMAIDRYAWNERGALQLIGSLLGPAETLYSAIRARLEPLGFTPFLTHAGQQDELLAVPVVIQRTSPRVILPAVLFLLTILTTLMAGAFYNGHDIFADPASILLGAPFSLTIMSILTAHEMGHYIVGRLRGAPVSLPYFIPLPPPLSFTGTMGAVITQREPMQDRRTILEIGLAGPIAGLVFAIPLLLYGLSTSVVGPPPSGGYAQEGNSILYAGMKYLIFGQMLPGNGLDVQLNDVAWGAWIGLLVTMLNLLPIGQLDGGHASYALLGRNADYVAYGVVAICVALGFTISETWFFWALLAMLFGPRHPPPLNDISRLSPAHVALAIFGLLLFVLLFMPAPLTIVQ
jgi:membrane-associated protease RseP (regulator of RpoE activity)